MERSDLYLTLKFVIKYPTRGRPSQFIRQMQTYRSMLSRKHPVRFVISIDEDDRFMKSKEMDNYFRRQKDCQVFVGQSKGKIEAVNADFDKLGNYDVLILASDDMIPTTRHYDLVIADLMKEHFPAMDGCLHFYDGLNAHGLNTMPIAGKRLIDKQGYIYQPDYISEWCDNEWQDVTERDGKSFKSEKILFCHEWIAKTGQDATFKRNSGFYSIDKLTYQRRKAAGFP